MYRGPQHRWPRISLVLLIFTVGCWVGSYWWQPRVIVWWHARRMVVEAEHGNLRVLYVTNGPDGSSQDDVTPQITWAMELLGDSETLEAQMLRDAQICFDNDEPRSRKELWGAAFGWDELFTERSLWSTWIYGGNLRLPFRLCVIALALVMGCRLLYGVRRGWGEGLCRVCGYDLRASPERCPECGTAVEVETGAIRNKAFGSGRRADVFLLGIAAVIVGWVLWSAHGARSSVLWSTDPLGLYAARGPVSAIANKLVQLHYVNEPVESVLEDLSRQAGVRFEIDWAAIQSIPVDPHQAVTFGDKNGSPMFLEAALRKFCLLNDGYLRSIHFLILPNRVLIGSEVKSPGPVVTKEYDVHDLIVYHDPCREIRDSERQDRFQFFLQQNVRTNGWSDDGGYFGVEFFGNDRMRVTAPEITQSEIESVLKLLRGG